MSLFKNKTVLVTGAAQGIGLAIARSFAKNDAHVLILDKDEEVGQRACLGLNDEGYEASFVFGNLAASREPMRLMSMIVDRVGTLDVLINNARSGQRVSFLDEREENWDETNDVIVKAAFFLSQAFVKHKKSLGNGGVILNIASVAANLATNESPSYHAAKAGLQQLTRYLAVSAAEFHVRVNSILPGLIVQDRHKARYEDINNSQYRDLAAVYQPMGKVGSERDVAEAALFICSDQAKYISGSCLVVDGGATVQEQFGMLLRSHNSSG